MLRITGYSDKYSVHPGEKVKFYINSESNENYEVQIVRLIHGDTNPEGPGYKEEELGASCNGNYEGRNQRIHGGSYVIIPQDERMNVGSFTLQAYIFPTTPDKGKQGILTKWNETSSSGYGLFVDDGSCEYYDGCGICGGDGLSCVPEAFEFNISQSQAFYFFNTVIINGVPSNTEKGLKMQNEAKYLQKKKMNQL